MRTWRILIPLIKREFCYFSERSIHCIHIDTGVLCDEVRNFLLQIKQIKSMIQCACVCLYAYVYGRVRMLASVFLHVFMCVCVYKDRDPTLINIVDGKHGITDTKMDTRMIERLN